MMKEMKHVAKVFAAAAIVAAIVGGSAFAQDTQKSQQIPQWLRTSDSSQPQQNNTNQSQQNQNRWGQASQNNTTQPQQNQNG